MNIPPNISDKIDNEAEKWRHRILEGDELDDCVVNDALLAIAKLSYSLAQEQCEELLVAVSELKYYIARQYGTTDPDELDKLIRGPNGCPYILCLKALANFRKAESGES